MHNSKFFNCFNYLKPVLCFDPSALVKFSPQADHVVSSLNCNSVHDSFQVELWSISKQGNYYSSEVGVVHTDKSRPLLLLELRDLLRLYSSELNRTFFAGTVIESSDLIHQELVVNWNIIRDGSVQNVIPYTRNISLTRGVNNTYQFGDFINLTNTPSNTIIQGDELMIWLTLQDNSGQEMFGFGLI